MTAIVVLLLVVGFLLLAVEVLVIPGFGVAGIFGIAALSAGGLLSWRHFGPFWGLGVVSGTILGSLLLLWIVARTRVGRSMSLETRLEGTTADESLDRLLGKRGETLSILRPSGTVLIDGERYTVLTEGVFMERGRPVRVVRVDAGKVVVEPLEEEEGGSQGQGDEGMESSGPGGPSNG